MLLTEPLLRTTIPLALFCSSHVGLSNVREPLIDGFGKIAGKLKLVNTGLQLPEVFVATKKVQDGTEIVSDVDFWPNEKVAGRQIFRIFYSAIAFWTLGYSLSSYYDAISSVTVGSGDYYESSKSLSTLLCIALASLAQGISIASLGNPSPLSLVPAWVPSDDVNNNNDAIFKRDDSLKLRPYGLTRITRHPLILPVLPWGVSNAILAGGRELDWILFGGLGVYAVIGCYAQDERAKRNAAVGTVFAEGDLTEFYDTTSFVPFIALLDGRQKWADVWREISKVKSVYIAAILIGLYLEMTLANFL